MYINTTKIFSYSISPPLCSNHLSTAVCISDVINKAGMVVNVQASLNEPTKPRPGELKLETEKNKCIHTEKKHQMKHADIMYSSKLEHTAHYKAKNQNTVKTNFCMRVFMLYWQSSVIPRFLTVRHGNRCTAYSHRVWEGGRERPRLSTRGYHHCFGLVVVPSMFWRHHYTSAWRDLGFHKGPQISEAESQRRMRLDGEGHGAFQWQWKEKLSKERGVQVQGLIPVVQFPFMQISNMIHKSQTGFVNRTTNVTCAASLSSEHHPQGLVHPHYTILAQKYKLSID